MNDAAAYELAQVTIARLAAPLESPQLKDFVDALDPVNADADAADGFLWRLQSESGNATDVPVLGGAWPIVNMSVWRDTGALTAFMYQGRHREMPARRREWFERLAEAVTALWWVPAGHRPTVEEAQLRLLHLRTHGPTPYAFTLRTSFPPDASEPVPAEVPADRPVRSAWRRGPSGCLGRAPHPALALRRYGGGTDVPVRGLRRGARGEAPENRWSRAAASFYRAHEPRRRGKDMPLYTL